MILRVVQRAKEDLLYMSRGLLSDGRTEQGTNNTTVDSVLSIYCNIAPELITADPTVTPFSRGRSGTPPGERETHVERPAPEWPQPHAR
jgi:hypothetical protein